MGGGCKLLVSPLSPALIGPLPLSGVGPGQGEIELPFIVPPAAPQTVTMQGLLADTGKPLGFTSTNGVQIDIQ